MLSYNIFPPEVEVIGTALFVLIWGCIILFSMRIFRWATLLFLRFFATSFESHFHQDCCRLFFFWKRELSLKTLLFEVSKECWGQELNQDDGLDIKIDNMRARMLKAWNYEMLVQDQ